MIGEGEGVGERSRLSTDGCCPDLASVTLLVCKSVVLRQVMRRPVMRSPVGEALCADLEEGVAVGHPQHPSAVGDEVNGPTHRHHRPTRESQLLGSLQRVCGCSRAVNPLLTQRDALEMERSGAGPTAGSRGGEDT
jgi:hypothetical protein